MPIIAQKNFSALSQGTTTYQIPRSLISGNEHFFYRLTAARGIERGQAD